MADQWTSNLNLECEVRSNKGKKVLVIKIYPVFISLVDPYIIPEMRYKLPGYV